MATAIKVENLSKAYQLGSIGTGTLSRDLERWMARIRGKEDPFLTIGEANDRSVKGTSDIVLSLNNVSFDIEQGDAVGIIGRNGAGKSTLLKLLSRVTSPTSGSIKVKGRIASLLEVGTGFHPELTGRENIFLNGAILGMRKKEIRRKFDEIVDFAGVERYIDTPVKRYSSGMYVRLAFAVAAHLESEILIVDEVLAVGDAEFQKKCIGKMGDVSKGEGRTVLFVSHNMASVKQLCNTGIVLDKGRIGMSGNINESIGYYKQQGILKDDKQIIELTKSKHVDLIIESIKINNNSNGIIELQENEKKIFFEIHGIAKQLFQFNIEIRIFSLEGIVVAFYSPAHINSEILTINEGHFDISDTVTLPKTMVAGEYILSIELSYPNSERYLLIEGITLIKHGSTTASGRTLTYNDIGFYLMEKELL